MPKFKLRVPKIDINKIRAAQADRELTRRMKKLLSGLESPYRRINWNWDNKEMRSQELPTEVASRIQQVFTDAGIDCSIQYSEDIEKSNIIIDTSEQHIDIKKILADHRQKVLDSTVIPDELKQQKELVRLISETWDEISTPNEDIFNILRDAPPALIQFAEMIDELFIGMKSSTTKSSTSETAVLHAVNVSNFALRLIAKSSPDLFRFIYKKTPIGPIFIAGYQLASDLFFARKWMQRRDEHLKTLFTAARRVEFINQMYETLSAFINDRIATKKSELQDLAQLKNDEMNELLDNNNTALLEGQPEEAKKLYDEIIELKDNLKKAEKSTKELTRELRKKASRQNTAQQVMMTMKHIDRIFNIAFIVFGIAAFFFPPLVVPTTIIAVAKAVTRKKLEDRIRMGTQIVQGIYDIDDQIVLTNSANNTALERSKELKKMTLEYAPVAIVAVKGIRLKSMFEKTLQNIRSNPEYTLYIPESFSYKQLGINATRRQIRGQVDAYSLACRQLIFHLGIIQGRDMNGNLTGEHIHPPHIHNIDALEDLLNDWSENLIQQIQDQQLNPPQYGKNSYFSDAQIQSIRELHSNAINYIDAYKNRIDVLDRKELDKDGNLIKLGYFDMGYAQKAHISIIDEINAYKKIIEHKTPEQTIKNADALIERLANKMNSLMNYCDKCPTTAHNETFEQWKKEFQEELLSLKQQMEHKKRIKTTPQKTSSERIRGINLEPSKNNQIFVTVHHARRFENRKAMLERLKENIAEKKESASNGQKTELVLLPVAKVTKKALFHYKGNYWKMMWLVRGIDRAIESVELTIKNKDTINAEINPKNQLAILNFYKEQLEKIQTHSDSFTFSKSGQEAVKKHTERALVRVNFLIEETQKHIPTGLAK